MKKWNKKFLIAGCAGLMAVSGMVTALAQSPVILAGGGQAAENSYGPGAADGGVSVGEMTADEEAGMGEMTAAETIRVWGPVLSVEDGSICIDNQSGVSSAGEMILHIAEGETLVLGAENGFPVELSDIQVGEVIYANIGQAMTMSLPPQTTAEVVICNVPADFKAPDYVQVQNMQWNEDGSGILTATSGSVYQIPADCPIIPYLTRNLVMLQDVTESRSLLVWSDAENVAQNLVLFAE